MSILTDQLEALRAARGVVDVYREGVRPDGILGRVLELSRHLILVEKIENGIYDGVCAIQTSDVTRLRVGDGELRLVGELSKSTPPSETLGDVGLIALTAAMTILHKRYGAVSLYSERLDPTMAFAGEPMDVDDDYVFFRQWGTMRTMDEYSLVLRSEDLTRVDADTPFLRQLAAARQLSAGQSKAGPD